jgi:hypothetical protein
MYFEETMSRDYLRGLVDAKKQADHEYHLGEVVKDVTQKIGAAASTGASCYLYDFSQVAVRESQMRQDAINNYHTAQRTLSSNTTFTINLPPTLAPRPIIPHDVVEALKVKCPGCVVSYQENWVQSPQPNTQQLKRDIYISWE